MPLVRGLFGNLEALVFGSAVGNDLMRPGIGVLAAGFHDSGRGGTPTLVFEGGECSTTLRVREW